MVLEVSVNTGIGAALKLMLLTISRDEYNSKEDSGKSLKNALDVLQYAKRHLLAEAAFNSEKIKPIALAVIELRFSEGIN